MSGQYRVSGNHTRLKMAVRSASGKSDRKSDGVGRGLLGPPPRWGIIKDTSGKDCLSSRVFVANIPMDSVQRMDLHSKFSKYGIVTEVLIHSKGFAFIQFKNRADAVAAIIAESGTYFGGRKITCEITKNPNKSGPSRNPIPRKEVMIGDLGSGNNKPQINPKPSSGHVKLVAAPSIPQVGGGGDAQTLQKDGGSESYRGAESSVSTLPTPLLAPSSTKQDHSLTLGLFMKKSKKPTKLVPFKKAGKKIGAANEATVDEKKLASDPGNLKSSAFSNFKFGDDLTAFSNYKFGDDLKVTQEAATGPFEELWDEEFINELERELYAEETTHFEGVNPVEGTHDMEYDAWEEENEMLANQFSEWRHTEASVAPETARDTSSMKVPLDNDESVWDDDSPIQSITPVSKTVPTPDTNVPTDHTSIFPSKQDDIDLGEEVDVVGIPCASPTDLIPGQNEKNKEWREEPPVDKSVSCVNQRTEDVKPGLTSASCQDDSNVLLGTKPDDVPTSENVCTVHESSLPKQSDAGKGNSSDARPDEKSSMPMSLSENTPPMSENTPPMSENTPPMSENTPTMSMVENTPPMSISENTPVVNNDESTLPQNQSVSSLTANPEIDLPTSQCTSIDQANPFISSASQGEYSSNLVSVCQSTDCLRNGYVIQNQQQPWRPRCATNMYPVAPVPVVVAPVQVQSRFGSQEPQLIATNYAVPYTPPVPPPPAMQPMQPIQRPAPPPTPPPQNIPPPTPPPQMYPSNLPLRTSQNITYGSLYPSRPVGGNVGGYMAYNVSMGGQPMYQHGQPVAMTQHGRQMPLGSGQMIPGIDRSRQRQLSGPSGFGSISPSPPGDVNDQRTRHVSGPSPTSTPPPPFPNQQQMPVGMNQPPVQGPQSANQQSMQYQGRSDNQPPMQFSGSSNQPSSSAVFSYEQDGQMVSRVNTSYLSSSGPYGTGMKNLSMSASAPLHQQLGFKDSSFPLTDMEKSKINSEFRQALEAAGGSLEVTDNSVLSIFMVLPEAIRRGIKRTGGLKAYFLQSGAFEVKGDVVALPGQMKSFGVKIQPAPGSYQGKSSYGLSCEATEFVPGGQKSSSANNKGNKMSDSWIERVASSGPTTRSRHNSTPESSRRTPTPTMSMTKTRNASVTDSVKAAMQSSSDRPYNLQDPYDSYYPIRADEALSKIPKDTEEKKKNEAVYRLIKDEKVADDLWELDSFLTEAYGCGYYKDYLTLSKELEKKSIDEAKSSSAKNLFQDITKSEKPKDQATSKEGTSSSSQLTTSSSSQLTTSSHKQDGLQVPSPAVSVGSSRGEHSRVQGQGQYDKMTTQEQNVDQHIQAYLEHDDGERRGEQIKEQNQAVVVENTCQVQVIDPGTFEKKTCLTFAAKLLGAANMHSESISTDSSTPHDGAANIQSESTSTDRSIPHDGAANILLESTNSSTPHDQEIVKKSSDEDELKSEEIGQIVEDEICDQDDFEKIDCEKLANNKDVDALGENLGLEEYAVMKNESSHSDAKIDKGNDLDSSGSWDTISNDSQDGTQRERNKQEELVDQFIVNEVTIALCELKKEKKKKSSKSSKSVTREDASARGAVVSSDSEVVKSKRTKVKCAAVFSTSDDECVARGTMLSEDKTNEGDTNTERLENTKDGDGSLECEVEIQETDVVGDIEQSVYFAKEDLGDKESLAFDVNKQSKDIPHGEEVHDISGDQTMDDNQNIMGKVSAGQNSRSSHVEQDKDQSLVACDTTNEAEQISTDISEKTTNVEEDTAEDSHDDRIETSIQETEDTNSETVQETVQSSPTTDTGSLNTRLEKWHQPHETEGTNSESVQDTIQTRPISNTGVKSMFEKWHQPHELYQENLDRPNEVEEDLIVQCEVAQSAAGNYIECIVDPIKEAAEARQSIGVNTDVVRTVHKGVVTSKVAKTSRVTNTVAVTMVPRGVMTTDEYEEEYKQKNAELENQIRVLEENLADERDKLMQQKHSYQSELNSLQDSLKSLTTKKNAAEDDLKLKRRQQVVEIRKTTAELRDTDARYSAQKSKVSALEKENSIITKELSAVTRELFDLQAIMEAESTRRRRNFSIDETTSTEDLQEADRREVVKNEDRARAMYERARDAELKVLKMQLERCQQALYKIQEKGQYTYNVYANSPQIGVHEKLQVNSQWSVYQSKVQEAIQSVLVDYERCVETLMLDGAALGELAPLQVPRLETFTPQTIVPSTMRTSPTLPSVMQSESSNLSMDAGLDELKSMTSQLLQPDLDLSKPAPNVPNMAGSAPLFSMGTLYGQQQSSSMHHPYNRVTREERLRSIQRRLGLNPDTGRRMASRTLGATGATLGASSILLGAAGAAGFGAAGAAGLGASGAASLGAASNKSSAPSLLGSNAFSFAMKQRSLASTYKSTRQRLPSSSSDDSTTHKMLTIPHQPAEQMQTLPTSAPSIDQKYPSIPRGRSLSSPAPSIASQPPEVMSDRHTRHSSSGPQDFHDSEMDVRQSPNEARDFAMHHERDNAESTHMEPKRYHQEAMEKPTERLQHDEIPLATSRYHSTVYVTPSEEESKLPGSDSYQQNAGSTQQLYQQSGNQYQQQDDQLYQEPNLASQERYDNSSQQSNVDVVSNSWESEIIAQENQSQCSSEETATMKHYKSPPQEERCEETPPSGNRSNKSYAPSQQETEYEKVSQSGLGDTQSEKAPFHHQMSANESGKRVSEPARGPSPPPAAPVRGPSPSPPPAAPVRGPSPVPMMQEPEFPKSEAIKAARSASPVEQLEKSWINLPPRLKARVVPKMTRSGGVTLKPLARSQETSSKRKESKRSSAWTGAGALAPINDVDGDGWVTVGKKKKKTLDIVEQQQKQQEEPASAPKAQHKGGSLDKIQSALSRQFPGISRHEVMETMKQIRINHSGSLSGVSMAVLVKEASSHIKNTSPKYMVSTKQRPTKELCSVYGCEGFCKLHEECDDICVICQDDLRDPPGGSTRGSGGMNPTNKVRMLDCGHVFHDECINVWYSTRERTCPICRCHTLLPDDFPALTKDDFPELVPSL